MRRRQSRERAPQARRRLYLRVALLAGCLSGAVALGSAALAATSFKDTAGDNNAAPDITSLTVAESADGFVTVSVAVANYRTLPFETWINVWFDLDNNPRTGDGGDEALVQFNDDGGIRFKRWVRSDLVRRPATGITGVYAAGVLTLNVPKRALDEAASFGVLAVGSRGQNNGEEDERVAADYAPNRGRAFYAAPDPLTVGDAPGDHEAAPDIAQVDVSDDASGRVRFAVSTPSHTKLKPFTWVEVEIDVDHRRSTGDGGVDVVVSLDGERDVWAGRWSAEEEEYVRVRGSGVTARSGAGVVTFSVPRAFLNDVATFGFYLLSGHSSDDEDNAIDIAPNGAAWWKYTLAHKPPVSLDAGNPRGIPARAVAGGRFTVAVPVARSDTARGITSGSVACDMRVAGDKIHATGAVRTGIASCSVVVPGDAAGAAIRGSMVVRSAGKVVTVPFAFPVAD
jgi:hypothetical protein